MEGNIVEILIEREQFWINYYRSYEREIGYNLAPTAGNSFGYRHSEETKRKLVDIHKGHRHSEDKIKMSLAHKGRKYKKRSVKRVISEETREKFRKATTGRKHSEETRAKMRQSHKKTAFVINGPPIIIK